MTHRDTGEAFEVHFIFVSPFGVRAALPYINRLNGLGIRSTGRAPEVSQWLYRMRTGSFDGGSIYYVPSKTPGIQLRNWLGSAAAEQDYGQNFARIKDPVVDYLIEKVITASTAEALYTATRALDRVILWNFYFIPGPSAPGYRLAFWDRFGEVRSQKLSRVPFLDTWWWDESKARRVAQGIAELGD